MTTFIRTLTAAALCSSVLVGPAAAACENGRCNTGAAAAEAKPLKLKTFMRKPVASSATRTVKKKNGDYAKVAVARRAKPRVGAPVAPLTPEISAAAAQAFAAYELARVRVVTPEEADNARQLADAATNATKVLAVDSVQIVRADEINDIDRKVDSPAAVSLDTLSRDLAGSREQIIPAEPKAETESWFQRMLMVFGGAFAGVAAMVRVLLA